MSEKSDNRVSIKFPPDILELTEKFAKERLAKERAENERREAEKAEQIRVRAARLQLGLEYATKVFQWAEALRISGPGMELMKKSHIPTAYTGLVFFDGHVDKIPWVGLGISTREGLFLTRGGRMSALMRQTIASPEDLAMAVETEILRTASEWIENGGVWECIRRRFDYLNDDK